MKNSPNNKTSNDELKSDKSKHKPKRKKSSLLIILFCFIAIVLFSRHEPVTTIDCTPEIIAKKPDVIMLGAWWCSYCYQAKKYFQQYEISYCEYDMENTVIGKQLYEENGSGPVPLMLIGERRLQGFNPQLIESALISLNKNPE